MDTGKETDRQKGAVAYCEIVIFWYREQEFVLQWGNSISMTFRYSNGIRQEGQLSPLLYNVYTDDLNHHLQATGVGCHVGLPGQIH